MFKSQKIIKIFCETPGFYTIGPKTTTSFCVCPIYPDMRRAFSSPKSLRIIADEIIKFIKKKKIKFDIVLGGVTAGIPLATAIGLLMNKPIGYVRKEPKAGGMGLAVEGNYKKGMKALLVDDALGYGAAKPKFIKNIRDAGLKIDWVVVAVSRTTTGKSGRECTAWVKKSKVKFQSFGDVYDMIKYSVTNRILTSGGGKLLKWYADDGKNWNKDPKKWAFFQNYLKMKKHPSKSGV